MLRHGLFRVLMVGREEFAGVDLAMRSSAPSRRQERPQVVHEVEFYENGVFSVSLDAVV